MIPALALGSGMSQLNSYALSDLQAPNALRASANQFSQLGSAMAKAGNMAFLNTPAFGAMMGASQASEMTIMMNRLVNKPLAEAQVRNAQEDLQKRLKMLYA